MELWVRSQRKTNLYKIDNINMDDNDYTLYYQLSWGQVELGQYKSKKRALEVLDEIQNIIRGKYAISLDMKAALSKDISQKEAEKILMQVAVYEMPEE